MDPAKAAEAQIVLSIRADGSLIVMSSAFKPRLGRIERIGSTKPGVWAIKHLVAPLDRLAYKLVGRPAPIPGRPNRNVLLLTTFGRRTGRARTTPVFFIREQERIVLCNVNPGFERPNPWTLNLRADPIARVRTVEGFAAYRAREATPQEADEYWRRLVAIWPAYEAFYQRGGKRSIFVLMPMERPS